MIEYIVITCLVLVGLLLLAGAIALLVSSIRDGDPALIGLGALAVLIVIAVAGICYLEIAEGDTRVVNGVTEKKECEQHGFTPVFNGKTTTMVPNYVCKWVAQGPNP